LLCGGPALIRINDDQQVNGRGDTVTGGIDEVRECIGGEGDAIVEALDAEGSIGGLPSSAVSAVGSTRHRDLVGWADGG
jgi:hypothetical protein